MWRLHGVDTPMRAAWEAGVVLTGVSAGSICWHAGGTTDSFGPDLRPVTNGLGLVPFSNGVHYDSEEPAPAAVPVADRRRHAAQPATPPTTAPACSTAAPSSSRRVTENDGRLAYRVERGGRTAPRSRPRSTPAGC